MLLRDRWSLGRSAGRLRVPVVLVVVWLVFGSAFVGGKIGVSAVPPLLFAGSRFLAAGAILLAWQAGRSGWRLPVSVRDAGAAALVGVGLILGGQGGTMWAVQYLPPGITAVLSSLTPVWVALISWVVLRQHMAALAVLGVVAGFAGVVFLASPSGGAGVPLGPALLVGGASVSWAAATVYASRTAVSRQPLTATAIQMLVGGTLQLVVGTALGETRQLHLAGLAGPPAVAWAWLLLGPSLVGFPLFTWLLANTSPPVANTQAYVGPVVALGLGWLILGEPLGPRTLLAVGVILAGVALIVSARGRRRAEPEPAAEREAA